MTSSWSREATLISAHCVLNGFTFNSYDPRLAGQFDGAALVGAQMCSMGFPVPPM